MVGHSPFHAMSCVWCSIFFVGFVAFMSYGAKEEDFKGPIFPLIFVLLCVGDVGEKKNQELYSFH